MQKSDIVDGEPWPYCQEQEKLWDIIRDRTSHIWVKFMRHDYLKISNVSYKKNCVYFTLTKETFSDAHEYIDVILVLSLPLLAISNGVPKPAYM